MQPIIDRIELVAKETGFTGAVSIQTDGEIVFRNAYGLRDRSNRLPNTVDTRFGIASGAKLLTALGIGALVDMDLLTLGTEVGELREDFRTYIDPAATVAQLLTHTSGTYDYYDEDVITDFDNFFVDIPWNRLTTPCDYLPLFEGQQMKYAPGERFSYSNGGYILLGVIIETISQQLYRDFIQQHILTPAGMHNSGFYAFNELPENTAFGYVAESNQTNIYNLPIRGASDGGLYTTLDDLNGLWVALFNHSILSESLTDEFLAPHFVFEDDGEDEDVDKDEVVSSTVSETTRSGYGYGIYWSETSTGAKMYYIVGGDAGVGFDSAFFPEQRTVVNILSNTTDGEEQMRSAIHDMLPL